MIQIPQQSRVGLGLLAIGAIMIFELIVSGGLVSRLLGVVGTIALALGTLLIGVSDDGDPV